MLNELIWVLTPDSVVVWRELKADIILSRAPLISVKITVNFDFISPKIFVASEDGPKYIVLNAELTFM